MVSPEQKSGSKGTDHFSGDEKKVLHFPQIFRTRKTKTDQTITPGRFRVFVRIGNRSVQRLDSQVAEINLALGIVSLQRKRSFAQTAFEVC